MTRTSRVIVSEKTLEMNICAEFLPLIRSFPGCQKSFWIGMKQRQEARNGLDELISNVPSGFHLMLQFKAPKSPSLVPKGFEFTLNDEQLRHLVRLANRRPEAVHYVLPHYNRFRSIRQDSPCLLQQTYLLPVEQLKGLAASSNKQGTHKVITEPPKAAIYSDPVEVELLSPGRMFQAILDTNMRERSLLTHEELRTWLREMFEQEKGNARAIGQRLRGLGTICVTDLY